MFDSFFSAEAFRLAKWAIEEKDRIKASKLYKIACKIEYRNRKYYGGLDKNMRFNDYFSTRPTPLILGTPPKGGSNVIRPNNQITVEGVVKNG